MHFFSSCSTWCRAKAKASFPSEEQCAVHAFRFRRWGTTFRLGRWKYWVGVATACCAQTVFNSCKDSRYSTIVTPKKIGTCSCDVIDHVYFKLPNFRFVQPLLRLLYGLIMFNRCISDISSKSYIKLLKFETAFWSFWRSWDITRAWTLSQTSGPSGLALPSPKLPPVPPVPPPRSDRHSMTRKPILIQNMISHFFNQNYEHDFPTLLEST